MARAKNHRNDNPSHKPVSSTAEATSATRKNGGSDIPAPFELEGEIRQRAYEIWEERGRIPGHEQEDWIRAEREVHARHDLQLV
jgi:hypothetical protein